MDTLGMDRHEARPVIAVHLFGCPVFGRAIRQASGQPIQDYRGCSCHGQRFSQTVLSADGSVRLMVRNDPLAFRCVVREGVLLGLNHRLEPAV